MTAKEFIEFRLVNILEKQFSMFPNMEIGDQVIEQKIGFTFGVEVSEYLLACGCTYALLINNIPLLHIEVVCQFQVEENDWSESLFRKKDNMVVLPNYFADCLASTVASTTRGVLYANTKETVLKNNPMSLINVHEILKGDEIEIPFHK